MSKMEAVVVKGLPLTVGLALELALPPVVSVLLSEAVVRPSTVANGERAIRKQSEAKLEGVRPLPLTTTGILTVAEAGLRVEPQPLLSTTLPSTGGTVATAGPPVVTTTGTGAGAAACKTTRSPADWLLAVLSPRDLHCCAAAAAAAVPTTFCRLWNRLGLGDARVGPDEGVVCSTEGLWE